MKLADRAASHISVLLKMLPGWNFTVYQMMTSIRLSAICFKCQENMKVIVSRGMSGRLLPGWPGIRNRASKKWWYFVFAPELRYLEDFRPKLNRCIHLQCAAGTDTLSLLNYGAKEVVGIDISEEMLRIAKMKSDALNANARWIHSDILSVPASLNGSADFIYTGKGAINWMMDIDAWAAVVARLLKPDGLLYLFEGHPITYCFDMKASELKIDPVYQGYFSEVPYASQDWPGSYVGKLKDNENEQATKYEKAWPVSRVITALLNAGFGLEKFEEHPEKFWDEFPHLPDELRQRFPNTYSVVARKSAT
ncbi:MAG: class I SAM-dependent methyltransferase [Bdellovibrionaceae bacterium]|nr:class I SAM-dependent methyltransferase [Pseudobdellovibrionaceae bacterium]